LVHGTQSEQLQQDLQEKMTIYINSHCRYLWL